MRRRAQQQPAEPRVLTYTARQWHDAGPRVPSPAACATTCIAAQEASLFCGREDGTVAVWDLDAARGGGRLQSERCAQSGSISTWRYQLGVATLQDI